MSDTRSKVLPSHEELARLARDDPAAYEALRQELIADFIEHAPMRLQSRLRGVQFRVDQVRALSRTALGSTVRVYELMWKSLHTLNFHLREVTALHDDLMAGRASAQPAMPLRSAQVIPFRRRA